MRVQVKKESALQNADSFFQYVLCLFVQQRQLQAFPAYKQNLTQTKPTVILSVGYRWLILLLAGNRWFFQKKVRQSIVLYKFNPCRFNGYLLSVKGLIIDILAYHEA